MTRMVWEALQLGSDARQGPLPRLLAGECSDEWHALGVSDQKTLYRLIEGSRGATGQRRDRGG
jgi:hypothetical protein